MPESHSVAYAGVRARVCEVLEAAGPDVGSRPTPATPEWTVHDVLAHLVGVADDVLNGRLDGAATDPWTANQVDRRRKMTVAELVVEWNDLAPAFDELVVNTPAEFSGQGLFDAATHEHDIRNALGVPGAPRQRRRRDAWDWFIDRAHAGARPRSASSPSPATRLPARARRFATVETSRFELVARRDGPPHRLRDRALRLAARAATRAAARRADVPPAYGVAGRIGVSRGTPSRDRS